MLVSLTANNVCHRESTDTALSSLKSNFGQTQPCPRKAHSLQVFSPILDISGFLQNWSLTFSSRTPKRSLLLDIEVSMEVEDRTQKSHKSVFLGI